MPELLVLGGGPGGVAAAQTAARLGAQVTLVERAALGGYLRTCRLHPRGGLPSHRLGT
jgi:pyruvate/2-oxoglutarate dehydrogenase complex dihydrolipoamide dehydrogenase (E3) component